MPGKDSTGPAGQGPGTGWGRGPCRRGVNRCLTRGFGMGFSELSLSKEEQKKILEAEKQEIEKRITELGE